MPEVRNLAIEEAERILDAQLETTVSYGESDLDLEAKHAEAVAEIERLEAIGGGVRTSENTK